MSGEGEWRYVGTQKYKKVSSFQTSESQFTCVPMEAVEIKFTIRLNEQVQCHIPIR